MKNFSTYLLVMFMIMFWVFRIIVAFTFSMAWDFVLKPLDMNFEVVLLFVAFVCIVLTIKRSTFGALVYVIGYCLYFGANLYQMFTGGITTSMYLDALVSIFGVLLPIFVLADLMVDRSAKNNPSDKKTDWFYKGKQYDRVFDERADRNEYKLR